MGSWYGNRNPRIEEGGRLIALLQRVSEARVAVPGEVIAEIGRGLLVFVAVEAGDKQPQAERLVERLVGYRVFPDEQGRMNRSLADIGGDLLLVPQFTLAAETAKGTRPGFSRAAPPETGRALFEYLVERARAAHPQVASARFGAEMKVTLTNEGPVTFWLRVAPATRRD
jgi:D-tyrosyl-tRNA(Tyr) deacylase